MTQKTVLCLHAFTLLATFCRIEGAFDESNPIRRLDSDLERGEHGIELMTVSELKDKDSQRSDDRDEDVGKSSNDGDEVNGDSSDSITKNEEDNEDGSDKDDEGLTDEDERDNRDEREEEDEKEDGDEKEADSEREDDDEIEAINDDDDDDCCTDSRNLFQRCSQSSDMCEMDVEPIGCFYDPVHRNRPLPILIRTHRDRGSHAFSGVLFNWKKGTRSIKRLLCDCVQIARKRGMSHIGLQHYGECWGSKTAARDYNNKGTSKACVNGIYKPCKPGEFCVGKEHANYVYAINSLNPVPCKMSYETVGCYHDPVLIKNRPLPYLLESRRDKTSHAFSGKLISWKNYHTSLSDLVCSCAQKAKAKGYKYFGIQYFGECWSGPGNISFRRHGKSSACKSAAFQQCKVKPGNCECLCTGDQHSNFVYKLV